MLLWKATTIAFKVHNFKSYQFLLSMGIEPMTLASLYNTLLFEPQQTFNTAWWMGIYIMYVCIYVLLYLLNETSKV